MFEVNDILSLKFEVILYAEHGYMFFLLEALSKLRRSNDTACRYGNDLYCICSPIIFSAVLSVGLCRRTPDCSMFLQHQKD